MLLSCMGSKDSSRVGTIADIVRNAITARALCRLYVLEKDAKFPRIVEGVPRSIVAARDGRERVVLAIDTAMEHSEVRVPLDRVVRAEQLDAQHNAIGDRSAGDVPHDRPAPAFSAPQQRRVEGPERAKSPAPSRKATVPRARAAKPVDRDTEPMTQPEVLAQAVRQASGEADDRRPTQPAMPRPRRRN
jgi:hypothetical protein